MVGLFRNPLFHSTRRVFPHSCVCVRVCVCVRALVCLSASVSMRQMRWISFVNWTPSMTKDLYACACANKFAASLTCPPPSSSPSLVSAGIWRSDASHARRCSLLRLRFHWCSYFHLLCMVFFVNALTSAEVTEQVPINTNISFEGAKQRSWTRDDACQTVLTRCVITVCAIVCASRPQFAAPKA